MKGSATLLSSLLLFLFWSCAKNNSSETWQRERDNIVDVEVVSIEDSLPLMHTHSCPILVLGDTLIFKDSQATDYIFTAYDVRKGRTLGKFGLFGGGPGEIANFGTVMLDHENRILYGCNGSQWTFVGLEIDKAIGDPDYRAFLKVRYPTDASKFPAPSGYFVNDSTVITDAYVPNDDWTAFEFRLGKLDLTTGLTTFLASPPVEDGARYQIAASKEHNLIVGTGLENDRVNLYDMDGNLKKSIYGANYRPEIRKKRYYNCSPLITDERIYFVYRRLRDWEYGDDIIELDHEGNYIRTLRVGMPMVRIQYHKGTNRLYFGSTAEPQFGYIQL